MNQFHPLVTNAPDCQFWNIGIPVGRRGLTEAEAQACADLLNDMNAAYPEWVSATERKIIGKLLDVALADPNILVSVRDEDGEPLVPVPTRDRAVIEAEIAATGITYLDFWPTGKVRNGWIMLVHGNDEDVISEHTANTWTYKLVEDTEEAVRLGL